MVKDALLEGSDFVIFEEKKGRIKFGLFC